MSKFLHGHIAKTIARCNYNTKRAKAAIQLDAQTDRQLHDALLALGVDQAIRDYHHGERRSAMGMAADVEHRTFDECRKVPGAEAKLQQKIERRLFWDKWALYGHKPLRIATREDLEESVINRRKMAGSLRVAAKFEEVVAHGLRHHQKVEERYTVDDLINLARQHRAIP